MFELKDINQPSLMLKILNDPELKKEVVCVSANLRDRKTMPNGVLRTLVTSHVQFQSDLISSYFGKVKFCMERSDYIDLSEDNGSLHGELDQEQYDEEDRLSPFAFSIYTDSDNFNTHAENIFSDVDPEQVFNLLESILSIDQHTENLENTDLLKVHHKRDQGIIKTFFPNLVSE